MAKKVRDYRAEYARRQSLAKARGFKSYGQQRRAIEKGTVAAIAPARIRTKRTADAQNARIANAMKFPPGFTIKGARLDMAEGWSNMHARSKLLAFDRKRAEKDSAYLDAYIAALVRIQPGRRDDTNRRLTPSADLERLLVDIMGVYTADEYESRYGSKSAGVLHDYRYRPTFHAHRSR